MLQTINFTKYHLKKRMLLDPNQVTKLIATEFSEEMDSIL